MLNADYAYNQYTLEKNIESKNGNPIMVNGTSFSTATNVQVRNNMIKLTPALGLNVRVSSKMELRLYVKYNYVLYDYEQLYKGERSSPVLKFKPNEKNYLFDNGGHAHWQHF